jgi:hypothetical protein
MTGEINRKLETSSEVQRNNDRTNSWITPLVTAKDNYITNWIHNYTQRF